MAEENRGLIGKLQVKGITLNLKLGALPIERIEKRSIPVDLVWTGSLISEGKPVVDYSLVCSTLKTSLKAEYRYIEELAGEILTVLKESWPGSWKVTVRKPEPPVDPPASEASVTVEG